MCASQSQVRSTEDDVCRMCAGRSQVMGNEQDELLCNVLGGASPHELIQVDLHDALRGLAWEGDQGTLPVLHWTSTHKIKCVAVI
jgi:hypothetical protein